MKYIDLHCDTAYRMIKEDLSLNYDACKVNIEKLKKGGALAQTFAFFVDLEEEKDPYDAFTSMYNNFIKEVDKNKDKIEIVRNTDELKQCNNNVKIGAFLSIEEGEVLKGDVNKVLDVYKKGIRMLTLTWNYENSIGYPNVNFKYKDKGLKEKGIEIVNEMERVGIIPDCSHHPRNLTDDMIKILSNQGGVMGLNFCSDFVAEDDITKVLKIAKHAKHIKNVAGIDVL